ncbi:uncharacterized protein LOC118181310 [Stegodyphus dumicola]|uniref:uncharacterized protein LOC118181310 n=1 Tax=Stegodyphus dumicola TaxID=202533 RepID=UPI0015A775A4|nr:uncharacterized protein LOC118181310 [Stegodyphus dumicola]
MNSSSEAKQRESQMGDAVLDALSKFDRCAKTKNEKIHRKLLWDWTNNENDDSYPAPRPKKTQIISASCLGLWCKDDDVEFVDVKLNVPIHESPKKNSGNGVCTSETSSNVSLLASRTKEFLLQACSVPKKTGLDDESSKRNRDRNTYTNPQGRSLSVSSLLRKGDRSKVDYKYPVHRYHRNIHRDQSLLQKTYFSNKSSSANEQKIKYVNVQRETHVNVQKQKPVIKENVKRENPFANRISNATTSSKSAKNSTVSIQLSSSNGEAFISKATASTKSSKNLTVSIELSSSNGEDFAEFMADMKALKNIRKQYPKLRDLIPEPNTERRNVKYSLEGVKCLLNFLFSGSCNFLSWKLALEMYAISQFFEVVGLQSKCHAFFLQNPATSENAREIIQYANYFGIKKELLMSETFLQEDDVFSSSPSNIYTRSCTITASTYLEPYEFPIPLTNAGPKSLDSIFSGDMKNDLEFESFQGSFRITGIQIKLEPDGKEIGKKLKIFCDVSNEFENIFFEETREKSLDSLIVIHFRNNLLVKPDQKAMISVVIDDLKPALCWAVEEDALRYQSYQGGFRLTIRSNQKLRGSKRKRFFIEKIFYTIRKEVN